MKSLQRVVRIIALGIGLTLGVAACSDAPQDGHPGHGIVKGVDTDARKVTLDHEEIPGLMKGMTMTFDVAPDVGLEDLQIGDSAEFQVEERQGTYTVTAIGRSGR